MHRTPGGPGVRLDGGPAFQGAVITPHYDSLLVKCICSGPDFNAARRKMLRALSEFRVRGIKNNILWLVKLLNHPTFKAGDKMWTTFIDDSSEHFTSVEQDVSRGQKLLRWIANLVVNGPQIKGQNGLPLLNSEIEPPIIPGFSANDLKTPCSSGWRQILIENGPEVLPVINSVFAVGVANWSESDTNSIY